MPIEARSDLFVALTSGDGDAVLGTAESAWLEFKQVPYRFDLNDGDVQRLELAKDVTAMANGGGGVIVIGYATEPNPSTGQDVAKAWSRFPMALVNYAQYAGIVEGQTFPPYRGMTLRWWLQEGEKAILTIEVAAASDQDVPILVERVREEGTRRALLMGLFERVNDRTGATAPAQIHAQIRLGRLMERAGIPPSGLPSSPPAGPSADERYTRLAADTRDGGLQGRRRYHLQAWPEGATQVRDIHEEEFRRFLMWPPSVRGPGFNLRTGQQPSTIPGGGLRILTRRSTISLQRNGLLTWVAAADSDFLAAADERRGPRHLLNQLALVEATLEFARLYVLGILPRCEPIIVRWAVEGGMADLRAANEASILPGGPLDLEFDLPLNVYGYEPKAAPDDSFQFGPLHFTSEQPGVVALSILRQVYENFGLPKTAIPYVTGDAINETLFPVT